MDLTDKNTSEDFDEKIADDEVADGKAPDSFGTPESDESVAVHEEPRSVSGVSVELSQEGQKAQRQNPENTIPPQYQTQHQQNPYPTEGYQGMPYGVAGYRGAYQTPYGTYVNPQEMYKLAQENKKHRSLAIAGLVLNILSISCFWMYGIGLITSVIGSAFAYISWIGGKHNTRKMGIAGAIIGGIALIMNIAVVIGIVSIINWDAVTLANIYSFQDIDMNDRNAMMQWLQQFLKIGMTG